MKKWTKEEQKEHRKQLVEALRSGEYKQGRWRLRNGDAFCCLGVACDISGVGEWEKLDNRQLTNYFYQTVDSYLPNDVRLYFGFISASGRYVDGALVELNDSGKSFSFIADVIESSPEGMFEE